MILSRRLRLQWPILGGGGGGNWALFSSEFIHGLLQGSEPEATTPHKMNENDKNNSGSELTTFRYFILFYFFNFLFEWFLDNFNINLIVYVIFNLYISFALLFFFYFLFCYVVFDILLSFWMVQVQRINTIIMTLNKYINKVESPKTQKLKTKRWRGMSVSEEAFFIFYF